MSWKSIAAVVLGVVAGIATAVMILAPDDRPAPIKTTGSPLIGGPFALVDPTGKRVTNKDFAGRPMVVFFGFTNCPDVCPSGLQVLGAALDKAGDKAKSVAPLFITVDPERDTVEKMGPYVKSFHPSIIGLTGTPDEVAAAVKVYRVYALKVPNKDDPNRYNVDHSSFFYLMDSHGNYVKHFPHTTDVDTLAQAIAALT
ncbi:MAG: SCO family protein [Hyphomicrobium sp.]|nr:SCO family protein [Hyphomicrobium sp.]